MSKVKRTERGWASHFIGSRQCRFHRNTLLEYGDRKVIVSTIGNYVPRSEVETIGYNRYYETMVFEAHKEGSYYEADVEKELPFSSDWAIPEIAEDTDLRADNMHEQVVKELSQAIKESK